MSKNKDVIVVARPDHSYHIYQALLRHHLKFLYVSYKLFPRWSSRFVKVSKVRYTDAHACIAKLLTLISILRFNMGCNFLQKISFKSLFERKVRKVLKHQTPSILHYWPFYSLDAVIAYKKKNRECYTVADIYYPNELYLLKHVAPILEKKGLKENLDRMRSDAKLTERLMEVEDHFLVPSQFIADTFLEFFPQKRFHIIPYGVSKSETYIHRPLKKDNDRISKFAFAGTIAIEKGCDILCEWFSKHPDLDLYLYGRINVNEVHLFKEYQQIKNIHFMGAVSKQQLQSDYTQYDVGIHLSLFDAYSLAVGEMIGTGLPVIVSHYTGIMDDVQKYNWGVVTGLEQEEITDSVNFMQNIQNYNGYLSSIHSYLTENQSTYGDQVVSFYKHVLQGKS